MDKTIVLLLCRLTTQKLVCLMSYCDIPKKLVHTDTQEVQQQLFSIHPRKLPNNLHADYQGAAHRLFDENVLPCL